MLLDLAAGCRGADGEERPSGRDLLTGELALFRCCTRCSGPASGDRPETAQVASPQQHQPDAARRERTGRVLPARKLRRAGRGAASSRSRRWQPRNWARCRARSWARSWVSAETSGFAAVCGCTCGSMLRSETVPSSSEPPSSAPSSPHDQQHRRCVGDRVMGPVGKGLLAGRELQQPEPPQRETSEVVGLLEHGVQPGRDVRALGTVDQVSMPVASSTRSPETVSGTVPSSGSTTIAVHSAACRAAMRRGSRSAARGWSARRAGPRSRPSCLPRHALLLGPQEPQHVPGRRPARHRHRVDGRGRSGPVGLHEPCSRDGNRCAAGLRYLAATIRSSQASRSDSTSTRLVSLRISWRAPG